MESLDTYGAIVTAFIAALEEGVVPHGSFSPRKSDDSCGKHSNEKSKLKRGGGAKGRRFRIGTK